MSSGLSTVLHNFIGLISDDYTDNATSSITEAPKSILKAASTLLLQAVNNQSSDMLTIAHTENPPYVNPCANYTDLLKTVACAYPGIMAETVTTILRSAKLAYRLVETANVAESIELVRQDGNACALAYDYEQRRSSFQFTQTISYDLPVAVYVHESQPPILNFMIVFDIKTWIVFGFVLGMFAVCSILIMWVVQSNKQMRHGSLLTHKVLFFTSILIGLILSLYENSLLSKLLVSRSSPLFNNLEGLSGLVAQKRLILTLIDDDTWRQQLLFDDRLNVLKRALKFNPVHWVPDRAAYERSLKSGANHVGLESLYSGYLFAIENEHTEVCELPYWLRTPIIMLCNRNLTEAVMTTLNKTIQNNVDYFQAIADRYSRLLTLQKAQRDHDATNLRLDRITFGDVHGMLLVWAVGLVVSCVYCVLEYFSMAFWQKCCADSIAVRATPSVRAISLAG